jgi:hypothetical protein
MQRNPHTASGLALPKDVGVSETQAAVISSRWDTITGIDEKLLAHGLHTNDVPDIAYPTVTAEALTDPDVQKYTVVFAAQLRWYNYATRLLADVRAVLLQVENEMEDIATSKRLQFRKLDEGKKDKDKMSATEMKDLIFQDVRYRDLRLEQQQLEQERIKLDAWAESLDRSLKTVSRQIENRRTESEGGRREGNMPAHGAGRWERGHSRPAG